MKSWTAHLKPGRNPVLVREAFSWGAFVFGAVWLLAQRAWIPAALYLALQIAVAALAPGAGVILAALALLCGIMGRDLVRWSLERRGYVMCHVLAARDGEAALARLLSARPDLVPAMAGLLR